MDGMYRLVAEETDFGVISTSFSLCFIPSIMESVPNNIRAQQHAEGAQVVGCAVGVDDGMETGFARMRMAGGEEERQDDCQQAPAEKTRMNRHGSDRIKNSHSYRPAPSLSAWGIRR